MDFVTRSRDATTGVTRYLVGGEGPPLVHLHSASGVRITPVIEALARTRTVYLPLMPGFDGTAPLPEGAGMRDVAHRTLDFVDEIVGGTTEVVGVSFGAWIACWLVWLEPARVVRLVLESPAGFSPEGSSSLEGDPATFLARAFAHPEKRRPETRTADTVAANRAAAGRYGGGVVRDLELVGLLSSVRVAALIIHGEKDGVVPAEAPRLLHAMLPVSTLHEIGDAAHNVEIDQPEAVIEAIGAFLGLPSGARE
ncbi:alpha/beta fold hydrolase [Amycolatopsis pigmentata]|uniref:Alpha/beta fold hydrolase n=1 Tax=Amycolatopsis pigmentata TaxID=450801 RepID=A0ABW5FLA4_9PSEU